MVDMTKTVAPKSDQLNSDDLIGKSLTIKITDIRATEGDQPVSVFFEGDGGKPYKPCKSMRRVMIHAWGSDGKSYIGRSMTLKRDPDVVFGGIKVGGIRIVEMSHITSPMTMALTATRASRKPYTVQPLKTEAAKPAPAIDLAALTQSGDDAATKGVEAYKEFFTKLSTAEKKSIEGLHGAWKAKAEKITNDQQQSEKGNENG